MAAENYVAAEAILRESCDMLAEMRERALLSSRAAELADAVSALGRFEEANEWTRLSRENAASDDMDAQTAWRAADAAAKAGVGLLTEAEEIARQAVGLAEETDMLNRQGQTLLVLAEVLLLQGRDEDALPPLQDALRIFELKDNVLSADRTRSRLEELVT